MMDIKRFFIGLAFLVVGYLVYRYLIKDQPPASAENNWIGPTPANYVSLWGGVIMCLMCGIVFILRSLSF